VCGLLDLVGEGGGELAVITHPGSHQDVDRSYGSLGAYVTEHALGVEGPLREFYVVGSHETADQALWRTEIGWPIFQTGPGPSSPNCADGSHLTGHLDGS
jgi:hypothetical protein